MTVVCMDSVVHKPSYRSPIVDWINLAQYKTMLLGERVDLGVDRKNAKRLCGAANKWAKNLAFKFEMRTEAGICYVYKSIKNLDEKRKANERVALLLKSRN